MPNDPFYQSNTWRKLVAATWQRAKGWCENPGCSSLGKTVDHIIPRKQSGKDVLSNLRLLCKACDNAVMQRSDGKRRRNGVLPGVDAAGNPTDSRHPWFA